MSSFTINLDKGSSYPRSSFDYKIRINDKKIVRDVPVHLVNKTISDGLNYTPLHVVAELGDAEGGKYLLNNGANENIRNFFNRTPRDIAIRNNDSQFLDMMDEFKSESLSKNLEITKNELESTRTECYNLRKRKRDLEDDLLNANDNLSKAVTEKEVWKRRCDTLKNTRK